MADLYQTSLPVTSLTAETQRFSHGWTRMNTDVGKAESRRTGLTGLTGWDGKKRRAGKRKAETRLPDASVFTVLRRDETARQALQSPAGEPGASGDEKVTTIRA